MKPIDLYEMKPTRIDKDINQLYGCYYNHVPEIDSFGFGAYINDEANTEIEIHYYKDHCFDGRRVWQLAAVSFKGTFVMIIQNAGREGDDWSERFITNKEHYDDMVKYIMTLLPPADDRSMDDVCELEEDVKGLDEFYGNKLDGYFEFH